MAVEDNTEIDVLVGQVVEERYRIEATLGAGGMGAVYRARHVKVGREVAIKVLHDHLVQDPTMVERFEREAAIAAKLDHKNLISVIDVGETATKQKLMVLELARGESLAAIIERGPLAPARVASLTAQILAGLEHAHGEGLVHRDLKPENIIIDVDDHGLEVPKIVDFGIAMLTTPSAHDASARLTAAGQVLGTPQYMAPEHAQGRDVDARCDLFALGVIVFEMLAGTLPFDGHGVDAAIANITQDPPSIAKRSSVDVPPLLEAFMRRLMARRRRDRFQSARAALDALELIETQPSAAAEILIRPAAPASLRIAPAPRGSAAPNRITLPMPAPMQREAPMPREARETIESLGVAATLEAPKPTRCRPPRPRPRARPWQPWKAIGLVAGAVAATITAAVASLVSRVEPEALVSYDHAMTARPQRLSLRAVTLEPSPPAAPITLEPPAVATRRARLTVNPRPLVLAAVAVGTIETVTETIHEPGKTRIPTAAELAARYVAVGEALAGTRAEALARSYRHIQLQRALATPATRAEALRALEQIERALTEALP